MPYRPKFCCQCGEKIERVDWKLLTSRRFCDLCATDFGLYDKIPLVVIGVCVLFGLFGLGNYFRAAEKPLNIAPNQLAGSAPNPSKAETTGTDRSTQVPPDVSVQTPAQTKTDVVPAKPNAKIEKADAPVQETTYFCGAMTKKGTPCSRKVKNGGRCWQHEGQTAMLPQEKLIVRNN